MRPQQVHFTALLDQDPHETLLVTTISSTCGYILGNCDCAHSAGGCADHQSLLDVTVHSMRIIVINTALSKLKLVENALWS